MLSVAHEHQQIENNTVRTSIKYLCPRDVVVVVVFYESSFAATRQVKILQEEEKQPGVVYYKTKWIGNSTGCRRGDFAILFCSLIEIQHPMVRCNYLLAVGPASPRRHTFVEFAVPRKKKSNSVRV
jgi:hypothetical protein